MENAKLTKELAPIKTQVSKIEQSATALTIKTADDLTQATEILGQIKQAGKQITEKKEAITKPLNEALKSARAFFAPIEAIWSNAERIVKDKMLTYQREQLAIAAKKTEVIEKKVEAGKMTFEKAAEKIEAVTPEKSLASENSAVQFRTVKKVVIEDESKLPREYLVPDMVKIRKVALAGVEIAGVKVVEEQSIASVNKYL